jgi:IS605 OrfB family transposase
MSLKAIKTRLKISKNASQLLLFLTREAKHLYNQALYNVRQAYIHDNHRYVDYYENYELLKTSNHYKVLNSSMAQAVLMKVDEAMKAFLGSVKSSNERTVRLPRYLDKFGFYPLIDRAVYKPNDDYYTLPRSNFIRKTSKLFNEKYKQDRDMFESIGFKNMFKELNVVIDTPKSIQQKKIKEITIKPRFDGRYFEVIHVYEDDDFLEDTQHTKPETMGIDLGYVNLATCAVTNGKHLLLDGNALKSYNQWYHKRMAYLKRTRTMTKNRLEKIQSKKDNKSDKKNSVLPYTKQMMRLELKRANRMTYGINKAARLIIDHATHYHVGLIVIGWNTGMKALGHNKTQNQWFKTIPLAKLRDRIMYLCKQKGIECTLCTEEYTSKASYFDDDDIPDFESRTEVTFSGKRTKRGLYVTKCGKKINADLNAALNILRKGNPNAVRLGFSGANTPKRTKLFS